MASFKRPDVYIEESLTTSATVSSGTTGTGVFIGSHFRGPTDKPVLIESWSQFTSVYGGFPAVATVASELPFGVYNYFSNGGRAAYIVRILGTGAVTSAVNLSDRAATPLVTLRITAANQGAWGNDLRVSIVDRDAANGRFDLLVFKGGTTDPFRVESWTNLSMVDTDPRHVEKVLNSPTTGSTYIRVQDMASPTVGATAMPAASSGTALVGGTDGALPTQAERTAAVGSGGLLDQIEGLATVCFPGETTAAVIGALTTYCETRETLFVVADTTAGLAPAGAVTYGDTLPVSSYLAVYYPWVYTSDPSSTTPGAVRLSPPSAFVAGQIAATDARVGVWKAPAGLNARLTGIVGTEQRALTSGSLDLLNENHVNAIRQVPGSGTVIWGARTQMVNNAAKYVNVRRTLNYIKDSLKQSTQFAIFENNDQELWNLLSSVCSRFLSGLYEQGGLRGATADQAFFVKCDADLNTPAVIASGQVIVEVGVALQQPAEFIVIRIGQWEGGASAAEA
jgi:phage tail sheath protein FI